MLRPLVLLSLFLVTVPVLFDPLPSEAALVTIKTAPGGSRDEVYPGGSGTFFSLNTLLDTTLVSISGTVVDTYSGNGDAGSSSAIIPSCASPSGLETIMQIENVVCSLMSTGMCCGRKANRWSTSFLEEMEYSYGAPIGNWNAAMAVMNNTFFGAMTPGLISRTLNATHLADPVYVNLTLCTSATAPEAFALTSSGSHIVFLNTGLDGPSLFSAERAANGSILSCASWTGDATNTCASAAHFTMRPFDWDKVVLLCDDVISGGNSTVYLTQSSGSSFSVLNITKLHPSSSDYEMLAAPGFGFPFYTTFGNRLESYGLGLDGTSLELVDDIPTSTRTSNVGLVIPPTRTHLLFGSSYFLHPRQIDIWERLTAAPTLFDPSPSASPPNLYGPTPWNLTFNATTTPSRYCYVTIANLGHTFQVQTLYDLSPCVLGLNSRPMPLLPTGSYLLELWVVGSDQTAQPSPSTTFFDVDSSTTMVSATVTPGGTNSSMMMDGQLTYLMAYASYSEYSLIVSAPLEDGTLYLYANSTILMGTLEMVFNESGVLTLDPGVEDGLYTQLTLTFEDAMGNQASALLSEAPMMMIQAESPGISGGEGTGEEGGTGTGDVGPPPSGGEGTGDEGSGAGTGIEGEGVTGGGGEEDEGGAGAGRMTYTSSTLDATTISILSGVGAAAIVLVLAALCSKASSTPLASQVPVSSTDLEIDDTLW